jgi:hypothetical protein
MKINEKTLFAFASSRSNDKEGFLLKRGEGKKNNFFAQSENTQTTDYASL